MFLSSCAVGTRPHGYPIQLFNKLELGSTKLSKNFFEKVIRLLPEWPDIN